jgi:glycosyltransferase involved in cell wall biosynthesis
MRILYCAIDQRVPGTRGGSIHVRAVADGLAALGHQVHVLVGPGPKGFPAGAVHWHALAAPFGSPRLRLARAPRVLALARALRPDVVLERYQNFGGEGLVAARRTGARAVLEVNAPVIDHPGSLKRLLDRLLLAEPMRRWRDWQCRVAELLVTPDATIVPAWVPRDRILEVEWGADTERFHPGARPEVPVPRTPDDTIAIFAGAFRTWHGAIKLVDAVARLRARGEHTLKAVFVGGGPELARTVRAAQGLEGVTFLGEVVHDEMPGLLAAADIGVAPFDLAAHAPLALGFYWSPLKVFEYMASGLPVVAPSIGRLRRIVNDGEEGILYDADDPEGLSRALRQLLDPGRRKRLGRSARARAVRDFSWKGHCSALDRAFSRLAERPGIVAR